MVKEGEQIVKMIDKYLSGAASTEETLLLNTWIEGFNNKPSLITSLSSNELEQVSSSMFLKISNALDAFSNNQKEKYDKKEYEKLLENR